MRAGHGTDGTDASQRMDKTVAYFLRLSITELSGSEHSTVLGLARLNTQSLVVRRFVTASHASQRPINRETTAPDESGKYSRGTVNETVGNNDRCSLQKRLDSKGIHDETSCH